MHTLIFGLWLFLNSVAPADEPSQFCFRNCSARQQEIWSAFQYTRFPRDNSPTSAVYSGECFHSGPGYDNEQVQYAVIFISKKDEQLHFSGEFAFFYDQDPYRGMSVDDALQRFPKHFTDSHRMSFDKLSAVADFSSKDDIYRYWLRPGRNQETLFLVGLWTTSHTLFCEMKRHAQ